MIDRNSKTVMTVATATAAAAAVLLVASKQLAARKGRQKVSRSNFPKPPQSVFDRKRSNHLINVRIPVANLLSSFSKDELAKVADDEGLVDCE